MRCLFGYACMLLSGAAMAADEPSHTVLRSEGDIQIREYASQIVAEVTVEADRDRAGSIAFRPLADYIFGNNAPREEIAMTTPVTTQRGQEIAMTTPVTTEAAAGNTWTVAFIMPEEWTMDTLPVPNNPAVQIREVPAQAMAAITFRGSSNDRNMLSHEAELREWLEAEGYSIIGEPVYASYSPPWVPVPMRRQEVMFEVERPAD